MSNNKAPISVEVPKEASLSETTVSDLRRYVAPPTAPERRATTTPQKQATFQPDVNAILDDALSVVVYEIIKLKNKSQKNLSSLDLSESRVLQGYIKCLTELSKEMREREDMRDVSNMSDEELLGLVEKMRSMPK